jgi:putative methyltransferase (TIGR04325 family)
LREALREIRRLAVETQQKVSDMHIGLADHLTQLDAAVRSQSAAENARLIDVMAAQHAELNEVLWFIHSRAPWRRQRLRELRADPSYERPYTESEPLISVVIPTYDNHRLLRERAIPSVLAQTYPNFEIVVVGDAASEAARDAVEGFGDRRLRFSNLPYRGPYPDDPQLRWLVAGVPPYNEAVQLARGLWIAPLDDDDAFRPHHLERLLAYARQEHLELAYSCMSEHTPDGAAPGRIGEFPPRYGQFGIQSTLYHRGLASIFELELADAVLRLPYDWGFCVRVMQAGVRIGMLDEETVDYYPSKEWTPRWSDVAEEAASGGKPNDQPSLPDWEFVPEGWKRANSVRGWDAEEVARSYREKWPGFVAAVRGNGPLGVYHEVQQGAVIERDDPWAQNMVLTWAYALARAANGAGALSVLDWGGALGHHYVLARELLPDVEFDYHCKELPAVCAEGRRVLPEVTFHDDDGWLARRYDLVLASGSLQYEEDWRARLRTLAEAAQGWFFVTRVLVATDHPSFVALQRAHRYGYATEYVGWVLNRDELLDAARACGVQLVRELALESGFTIDGAPETVANRGFLFRRVAAQA